MFVAGYWIVVWFVLGKIFEFPTISCRLLIFIESRSQRMFKPLKSVAGSIILKDWRFCFFCLGVINWFYLNSLWSLWCRNNFLHFRRGQRGFSTRFCWSFRLRRLYPRFFFLKHLLLPGDFPIIIAISWGLNVLWDSFLPDLRFHYCLALDKQRILPILLSDIIIALLAVFISTYHLTIPFVPQSTQSAKRIVAYWNGSF